jgi:hypothetical protein
MLKLKFGELMCLKMLATAYVDSIHCMCLYTKDIAYAMCFVLVLKCLVKHCTYSKVISKFIQYFVGLHTVSHNQFHVNNNNNNNNNNLLARYGYKDYKLSTLFLQFVEWTSFWFALISNFGFRISCFLCVCRGSIRCSVLLVTPVKGPVTAA